jgi:predicted DNA-binding transcriptional regulator YafY
MNLIAGESGLTAPKLAQILGKDIRTVYRDISELREAGILIEASNDPPGYSLPRNLYLKPIDFSLEEAIALSLLTGAGTSNGEIVAPQVARIALEKIRAALPHAIRESVQELLHHTSVKFARTQAHEPRDVHETVRLAIQEKRALRCTYESPKKSQESKPFRFDPYALHFAQRAWYVVGRHHGHKEIRTLKLSRFVQCQKGSTPYMIPDDFSIDQYHGKAWRMIRSGKIYNVQLRFNKEFAETVADTHWHDTQQVEYLDDGSIEMRFEVDGLDEITWWILSYGPGCQVIRPAELRVKLRKLLRENLKQYAKG